jgi:transcriptional regulator with XRE-family HTH domain
MARPPRERSAFGERLLAARKHAGLSQSDLAKAVGMSQSGLAEAEMSAQGSSKTAQIAAVTGVNPKWLADGEGAMLIAAEPAPPYQIAPTTRPAASPIPIGPSVAVHSLISQLGELLEQHDHLARLSIAPLLQRLAEHPQERAAIAQHVHRALSGSMGNERAPESSDSQTGAKQTTGK